MAMKKKELEKEEAQDWMATYADTVTLLMAFFVLLLSMATMDQSKVEGFEAGISEVMLKTKKKKPFAAIQDELEEMIEKEELKEDVIIEKDPLGVKISFSSNLLFSSGSATLRRKMDPIIASITKTVQEAGYEKYVIKVDGHTDDVAIRTKQFPSNWELSTSRASGMVRALIKGGIPPKRLKASGYADSRPLVPNKDENGKGIRKNRETNRRVVMFIHRQTIEDILNTGYEDNDSEKVKAKVRAEKDKKRREKEKAKKKAEKEK